MPAPTPKAVPPSLVVRSVPVPVPQHQRPENQPAPEAFLEALLKPLRPLVLPFTDLVPCPLHDRRQQQNQQRPNCRRRHRAPPVSQNSVPFSGGGGSSR